jgi:tetratricopeptide (TPR) repeat protein
LAFDRYAAAVVLSTVLVGGAAVVLLGTRNAKEPPQVPSRNAPRPQAPPAEAALPQGHPPVALPDDIREALSRKAAEIATKPDDVAGRKQLGLMQYRAGLIDPAYLPDAVKTYESVLAHNPNDLDALRALGDLAVDAQQTERAMGFYDRFLTVQPDDPYVRTQVGNLHLSARKTTEAIAAYERALAADPTLFQAQLGVAFAYAAAGDPAKAVDGLKRARGLATDDASRKQVDDILARLNAPRPAAAADAPSGSLKADVEAIFRSHPIVAPKLDRVEWPDDRTAKVVVREFPMEAMPPFARDKFNERIKTGVRESKTKHQVTQPITIQIVDSATGQVMSTLSE